MLDNLETAAHKARSGKWLLIAGDEALLAALPRGNWIGGTIPYFLDDAGFSDREHLFVAELPGPVVSVRVGRYAPDQLGAIPEATPDPGYTLLVIPSGGQTHRRFAREAPEYAGSYLKPVVGWVSGVHLDDLGRRSAKVADGTRLELVADEALALHVQLPPSKLASVRIANPFVQGPGDVLRFEEEGFEIQHCLVNGQRRSMAQYLRAVEADTRWPLVADYMGTMVNVSFQNVDAERERVSFYAPVFRGVEYRLAAPPRDALDLGLQKAGSAEFACSCVLNYLYGELEGKPVPGVRGPVTFGEIAYQLLNQTSVFLDIVDRA